MPKELFGTDGIRGVPGEYPLDDATLFRAGQALGDFLRAAPSPQKPRVLIGMDTRESGPHIAGCLAQGLRAATCEPVSAGVVTTPGVAWLVHAEGFAAGAVVSASHNPYTDNGVKLISSSGMKFPDEAEARMEAEILAAEKSYASLPALTANGLTASGKLLDDYLAALRAAIFPGANFKGMKIVLDCANGAASALAPKLFRSLGVDVISIFDRPSGRNINAGCGSLHPEALQKKIVETGAALGVAFDGDADRAIFCAPNGHIVDGDGVLYAAARYLNTSGKLRGRAIVGTSMANLGLERALDREGLKLTRVPVGDRYVLEEMIRSGANLGGEQSGHIIFLDDATTGDGMLTAVKIASLVSIAGPLDSLVAELKIFPQAIVNVRVRSKPPLESLPEVTNALAEAEKALGNSGRVVLRYSGTEPLARVMVEAESAEGVERFSRCIAAAIRSAIGTN